MSESTQEHEIALTDEQLEVIMNELDSGDSLDDIEDALFQERHIYLSGEVNGDMSSNIVPMIHYYNIQDDKDEIAPEDRVPIKIFIDSEGGEVYRGFNILSAIERSKTPVWTYAEGTIGMSMAFVLYLAGERRYMSRFASLLYHEVRAGSDVKTLAEMKNTIRHYENLQNRMDSYIAERTNIPLKKLKEKRKQNIDWYIDYDIAKNYKVFTHEF